jgi:hypothetical protein
VGAELLQRVGRFSSLVLGRLELLPQDRVDAKARGVVDDHDTVPGVRCSAGRPLASARLAGITVNPAVVSRAVSSALTPGRSVWRRRHQATARGCHYQRQRIKLQL